MSGGSYNYIYFKIEEECFGRMHDIELNEMVEDFAKLMHDLEWWQSCDIEEESYRRAVADFKKKWFSRTKDDVQSLIDKKLEETRKELFDCFDYLGGDKGE